MKYKKVLYYLLMVLPLIVVAIALQYLPDQIPAHYDFNNQITRWGSKYETLIFPLFAILFGLFMLGVAKYSSKEEQNGKQNENTIILTGIVCLLFFNLLTGYFLYLDFYSITDLNLTPITIYQVIFGLLGIGFILLGKLMPKFSLNSTFGLRTIWSMKNEITWQKSQQFGGKSFIVCGALIFLISLLVKGSACLICSLAILLIMLFIDIYYTYKIAQIY